MDSRPWPRVTTLLLCKRFDDRKGRDHTLHGMHTWPRAVGVPSTYLGGSPVLAIRLEACVYLSIHRGDSAASGCVMRITCVDSSGEEGEVVAPTTLMLPTVPDGVKAGGFEFTVETAVAGLHRLRVYLDDRLDAELPFVVAEGPP